MDKRKCKNFSYVTQCIELFKYACDITKYYSNDSCFYITIFSSRFSSFIDNNLIKIYKLAPKSENIYKML